MRVTILVDNLAARGLEAEWGLSIYVEYQGHAILLDTGASDRFARNADTLGIDLSTVSFGVLSHAHWDHGNGMGTFFARNPTAPFYLRQGCGETCYDKTPEGWRYEGLQRGLLTTFAPRIRYVTGDFSPLPGVTLLPHKTPGLAQRGLAANMYRKVPWALPMPTASASQSTTAIKRFTSSRSTRFVLLWEIPSSTPEMAPSSHSTDTPTA